jgi:hypothetical protein
MCNSLQEVQMAEQDRNRDIGTRRDELSGKPQTEKKHPDEYAGDLNPHRLAGQNIGIPQDDLPTAYDVKQVHRSLTDFADDELRKIPLVPEGERLRQGATYMDLENPARGEFTATGEMSAASGQTIVPKSEVPYTLWNRLRGVESPERST